MEKNMKDLLKKNSSNAIKDVDPTDVVEVIKKIIKIFTDLAKPKS